jgi:hypothetical protein
LHGLDGKKAKAPSMPRIIPAVGSESSLRFSSVVQIARCQTAHLVLLMFSMLGYRSPSLATDLDTHPVPLHVMAAGEIMANVLMAGAPSQCPLAVISSGRGEHLLNRASQPGLAPLL